MTRKTRIPALECICEAILSNGKKCGHRWYSISKKLPEACPSRECRSREWNGKKKRTVKSRIRIDLPKPRKVKVYDDEY